MPKIRRRVGKNTKIKMTKLFRVVCLFLILTTTSSLQACNLRKNRVHFTTDFMVKDTVSHNSIPDSVMNIVFNSSVVGVSLYKSSMDTIPIVEKNIVLDREQMGALKFAFMLSKIKSSVAIPFTSFKPKVSYQFAKGKESCSMQIDFGSGQMKVLCKDNESMYSLYDQILLTEAVMLFKDDDFLKFILNNSENQ